MPVKFWPYAHPKHIMHLLRSGHFQRIIPMSKDDTTQPETSPTTSTETRSMSEAELRAVAVWKERMKPSRQRNLTPLQRKELAETLRMFRRARSGDQDVVWATSP